jgi:hypothetical protein
MKRKISKRIGHIPDSSLRGRNLLPDTSEVLYDDPNSFLRASNTVFLHDMQGASLKTKKPMIEDVKLGMETSSRIIQFSNELDAVDIRFKWISTNLGQVQFGAITLETTMRELLKYIGLCNASLRSLKKSTTIQAEDLQKIYSIAESLDDTHDQIKNEISIGDVDDELIQSSTFQKMMQDIEKLVLSCAQFISMKNIDSNVNIQQTPIVVNQDLPNDLEPEPFVGGRRCFGGSHFRVLSSRVRDIQKEPYKRFI